MLNSQYEFLMSFYNLYIKQISNSYSNIGTELSANLSTFKLSMADQKVIKSNSLIEKFGQFAENCQEISKNTLLDFQVEIIDTFKQEFYQGGSTESLNEKKIQMRKARKNVQVFVNNYEKLYDKLAKLYQTGVSTNESKKLSSVDSFSEITKFMVQVKQILKEIEEYSYLIVVLFKDLQDQDKVAENAFCASFERFEIFVNTKLSKIDQNGINYLSNHFQEVSSWFNLNSRNLSA